MNQRTSKTPVATTISYWIFIGLLAYMPLHIFLSTWLGTSFGILQVMKLLKDAAMITGFLFALLPVLKNRWLHELVKDKLIWLIMGYGLLTLLMAAIKPTASEAEILGVIYNTRFFLFFLYAVVLSKQIDLPKLRQDSLKAVLASAIVVLMFGILQYTVLPSTTLQHFGYQRSNGVLPAFFIDDKPDLERIMSTLRDPNSYGSYLIIIGALSLVLLVKRPKLKKVAVGFLALCVLNVWYTFSRSAWIGFLLMTTVIFVVHHKNSLKRLITKKVLIVASVSFVIFLGFIFVNRNSYFIQNVVLHADNSTVLEDPNQLRIRFWRESTTRVVQNPLGSGPGTAGLASIRNNVQGTKLNENYYLQIGSEVGLIGLVIFLAILIIVGWRLWGLIEADWLALALFGSFIGLLVTNFLVHIWSSEAVAYTWWGLAGLVIYNSPKLTTKKRTKAK